MLHRMWDKVVQKLALDLMISLKILFERIMGEPEANLDNTCIKCHNVVNANNKDNDKYDKNTQYLLDEFLIA